MKQWEYKHVKYFSINDLNNYGMKGWEIVSIIRTNQNYLEDEDLTMEVIFKR